MARKRRRKPHGQGCVYKRGKNNWWIAWREGGKRRTRGGYPTEDEANDLLARITADVRAGRDAMPVVAKDVPELGELANAWIKRRQLTHRSANEDQWRWSKHLSPWFAKLQPSAVDPALLRKFIEAKLAEGLSSTTVRLLVLEMSGLFSDLVEQGHAAHNPVRLLPRSTRRLIRSAHDPRTTPFVEQLADVRRIYLAMEEPVSIAYAIGALGGLRTDEIVGLPWVHVDLATRRIHVRVTAKGPLKDDESRVVPILDGLYPVLTAWKLKTGGTGTVVPAMRSDGAFCDDHTLRAHLKTAQEKLKLPTITWYQATRHTFASQWVMGGGSIEKLKEILGHSTVQVTERYAHLKTDLFPAKDLGTIALDLRPGSSKTGKIGYAVVTAPAPKKKKAA
jgi:integrase